jgi:hypothetical protein
LPGGNEEGYKIFSHDSKPPGQESDSRPPDALKMYGGVEVKLLCFLQGKCLQYQLDRGLDMLVKINIPVPG